MKLIGLTGSIGTGKTSVSKILRKKGIEVIDADEISRRVSEVGNEGYKKIVDLFGSNVLNEDGSLDRKKIGSIVFSNRQKLKELNEAMHPIIIKAIKGRLHQIEQMGNAFAVLDAPLLIETGLHEIVDVVLLIVCSEDVQLERIQKRDGLSKEQAMSRVKSQMSQGDKKKHADYIIDNSKDIESLEMEVEKFLDTMEVTKN